MRALQLAALPRLCSYLTNGLLRPRVLAAAILGAASALSPSAFAQDAIVQKGFAVVTGFSGFTPSTEGPEGSDPLDYLTVNSSGPAAQVVDLTTIGAQGGVSDAPKTFTLSAAQVGQVFGVALDRKAAPNIYLGASSAYGLSIYVTDENGALKRTRTGAPGAQFVPGQFGPPEQGGGPGSIWKVDGATGEVSLFASIDGGTGSVAGLGALAFDPVSGQLFASERGSGIVFRLGPDGTVNGTFDHGTEGRSEAGMPPVAMAPSAPVDITSPAFDTENPATWGVAPPARRVWGLAVYNKRLYYSVAQGPQIWSAAISSSGAVSGARMEIDVPSLADGEEIASIAFDGQGRMYLAERGTTSGDYEMKALAQEGQSRVLRYVPKPAGDPSPGRWRLTPDIYSVGYPPNYANANGGVALNYGYRADGTINLAACAATVWSSGERLLDPADGSEGFPTVDGIQGNPTTLFQPQNSPPTQSWFVDYDDQAGDPAFRGYMGAIATIPCTGTVVPPPVICPKNSYMQNGICVLYPTCPTGTTFKNGACVYPQCPEGMIRQGNKCVPPPQECGPNSVFFQGKCVPLDCPPDMIRTPNGYCTCPISQTLSIEGQCVPVGCPFGLEMYKGQCVPHCVFPLVRQKNGSCGLTIPTCDLSTHEIYKGQCVEQCKFPLVRKPDGSCGFIIACNMQTHEWYKGQCVEKCVFPKVRQPDGSCKINIIGPKFPLCDLSTHDIVGKQCLPKCVFPKVRQPDGSCKVNIIGPKFPLCDLGTHEMVGKQCLPKCTPPAIRLKNGNCASLVPLDPGKIKIIDPTCSGGEELFKGACVEKCTPPQIRQKDGSCGLKLIGPVLKIDPNKLKALTPTCNADEKVVNGKCVAKCDPPEVYQKDGSCKAPPVLLNPKIMLQPIKP